MPYYDYKCQNEDCAKLHKNIFHSIHVDRPACPDCGGELKTFFTTAPPDLGSSMRVQTGIDRIRQSTRDKYLK